MTEEKRYVLGKCDYNGSGRKDCEAAITWKLEDGKFSMCAEIWNPRKTDILTGGQCVDTVAALFPADKQAQRMLAVWQEWHLNDLTAGSPAQMAYLKQNPVEPYDYTKACEVLKKARLNPDANYLHNGKPYEYGTAWLKRELPPEIVEEINGWSETPAYTYDKETKERKPKKSAFELFLEKNFTLTCEYEGFENNMDCYKCTIERIVNPDPNFHGKKTGAKMKTEWKQGTGHRIDNSGQRWREREDRAEPSLVKVMDAVIRDALAYSDYRDVADFADVFGYEDFREARRIWQACENQYNNLQKVAGNLFHKLLDADFVGESA